MTKQDETELKEILSKFATIDGFLDSLKEIETYAASTYIEENAYKHFRFNSNTYFTFRHIVNNCYKIAFSYNDNLYDISFVETVYAQPSQEFARALVQEAKEIFERLDKELREERALEFAYKIYKPNNKTKYVSELKDIVGAELAKKQIQKSVEYSPDSTEEEFVEINNNYIKPSTVVAIYEEVFEYPCVKIILKGGQEIKVKHESAANVFDFLVKNKESFSNIGNMYMTAYIRPEYAVAIYADTNCKYNVICVTLKYGGKVLFPASWYTANQIIEQLEKGCHE